MYNILRTSRKGKYLGVWIFNENELGVFIPSKCISRIVEFFEELSLVGTGHHETYGHVRCRVESNGILIEDCPYEEGNECVLIHNDMLKAFTTDLRSFIE